MAIATNDNAVAAQAATIHFRELGARYPATPALIAGSKRLNSRRMRSSIMLSRIETLREPERAMARAAQHCADRLFHEVRKTCAGCVGCEHLFVPVETLARHQSDESELCMTAACDQHVCKHDIVQPTMTMDDCFDAAGYMPSPSQMGAYMNTLRPAVKPIRTSVDVPLTGTDDAW